MASALTDPIYVSASASASSEASPIKKPITMKKQNCYDTCPFTYDDIAHYSDSTVTLHTSRRLHHALSVVGLIGFLLTELDSMNKTPFCIFDKSSRLKQSGSKKKIKFTPLLDYIDCTLGFVCPCVSNDVQCDYVLPIDIVFELVRKTDPPLLEKLKKLSLRKLIDLYDGEGKVIFCKNPLCQYCDGYVMIDDSLISDNVFKCNGILTSDGSKCLQTTCMKCRASPHHEGISCKMYELLKSSSVELTPDNIAIASSSVICPGNKGGTPCKYLISKVSGCDHMICAKCDTHFCWNCGKITGSDPYGRHLVVVNGQYVCSKFFDSLTGEFNKELYDEELNKRHLAVLSALAST